MHAGHCSLGSHAMHAASSRCGAGLLEPLQNQTGQDRVDAAECILGYHPWFSEPTVISRPRGFQKSSKQDSGTPVFPSPTLPGGEVPWIGQRSHSQPEALD